MKKIEWETPKEKSDAHARLVKMFGVNKSFVSLSMSFKRNSLLASRLRHVALHELGGRLLSDDGTPETAPIKVLDSHGNVKAVIK